MMQNPELLRKIMLAAERQPAGKPMTGTDLKGCCDDPHELGDHVQQLIEAGYVDGVVHINPGLTPKIRLNRLTFHGHEFLHAMRDDSIWKMVKEKVMLPTASWSLKLAAAYAIKLAATHLGLPGVPPHS